MSYSGQPADAWLASGFTAAGPVHVGMVNPGPDVCRYTPPPFDVLGKTSGLPNPGFTNFPLAVLP